MFYSINITCFTMYLLFETLSNGNIKKEGNGHSFPLPLAKYRYIGVQIAFEYTQQKGVDTEKDKRRKLNFQIFNGLFKVYHAIGKGKLLINFSFI